MKVKKFLLTAALLWGSAIISLQASDEVSPVVIDNGSFFTKAGIAGDDAPRSVFRTVVGRNGSTKKIGKAALSDSALTLNYPLTNGVVNNWDDMEAIWEHTFSAELRVAPEEHPVIMVADSLTSNLSREYMCQIMFGTFNVPSLYLAPSANMSLLEAGRSTGAVVESGHGRTSVVCVHEGYLDRSSSRLLTIGGKDLPHSSLKCNAP